MMKILSHSIILISFLLFMWYHSVFSDKTKHADLVFLTSSKPNLISINPTFSTNPRASSNQLIPINVATQAALKLTTFNHTSWRAQFNTLLFCYNLSGNIDIAWCSPTISKNGKEALSPNYLLWKTTLVASQMSYWPLFQRESLPSLTQQRPPLLRCQNSPPCMFSPLIAMFFRYKRTLLFSLEEQNTSLNTCRVLNVLLTNLLGAPLGNGYLCLTRFFSDSILSTRKYHLLWEVKKLPLVSKSYMTSCLAL